MLVCGALPASAQAMDGSEQKEPEFPPPRGELTRSMGFPSRWIPYVGAW
jgi:hypothetical protein